MTDRLDEIRKRLEAATPGPWSPPRNPDGIRRVDSAPPEWPIRRQFEDDQGRRCSQYPACAYSLEDADFVAHAPEDIAYLLAEVDRLRDLSRPKTRKVPRVPFVIEED